LGHAEVFEKEVGDVSERPRARKRTLQTRTQQLEVGSSSRFDITEGAGRPSRLATSDPRVSLPGCPRYALVQLHRVAMEDVVLFQLSIGILEEELQVVAVHSNVTSTVQPGS
jgi:hypothetical protein